MTPSHRKLSLLLVLLTALAALAQPTWAAVPTVKYSHFDINANRAYRVSVNSGGFFEVVVKDTCEAEFTYSYEAVRVETRATTSAEGNFLRAQRAGCAVTDSVTLQIPHDEQFGGYWIYIKSNAGQPVQAVKDKKTKDLQDVSLMITADPLGWQLGFAGAYLGSTLTDEQFALTTRTVDGEEKQFLIRDREIEDEYRLGVAGMIHVFHQKKPWLAGTFGLGLTEGADNLSFFIGPSIRLGGQAYLTVGWNLGKIQGKPRGVEIADFDDDLPDMPVMPDVLNNLTSRTDSGFFFAFSYSFLGTGVKDRLQKPFKQPE